MAILIYVCRRGKLLLEIGHGNTYHNCSFADQETIEPVNNKLFVTLSEPLGALP